MPDVNHIFLNKNFIAPFEEFEPIYSNIFFTGGVIRCLNGFFSILQTAFAILPTAVLLVGDSIGPQLMAEIGDVTRFAHKGSLTAFAGVDPGANQSGTKESKSNKSSKRGSPGLRKTLFILMTIFFKYPLTFYLQAYKIKSHFSLLYQVK